MAKAKNLKISLHCVFLLALVVLPVAYAQNEQPIVEPDNTEEEATKVQQAGEDQAAKTAPSENGEATNTTASTQRFSPTPEQIIKAEQQLLAARAPKNTTPVWLKYQNTARLAFWRPSTAAAPLGAVLVVFDRGEHLLTSLLLANSLEHLPNHGWATLAIYLNDLPEPAIPKRPPGASRDEDNTADGAAQDEPGQDDSAEQAPQKADMDDEPVDETQVVYEDEEVETEVVENSASSSKQEDAPQAPPEELAKGLIGEAISHLQSQGQYNIVLLGEGLGATRALAYTAGEGLSPPPSVETQKPAKAKAVIDRPIRALILVDTLHLAAPPAGSLIADDSAQDNEAQEIGALLTTPNIPVLDLYIENTRLKAQQALDRKRAARAKKYVNYVQRKWTTPPVADDSRGENKVTRAIRHFLDAHAKGVQLE